MGNNNDFKFHHDGTNNHVQNLGADSSRIYINKNGGTASYIALESLDVRPYAILIRKNATTTFDAIWFGNSNGNRGEITVSSGSMTYSDTSDYRLKENVVDITNGITKVKQLKPKRFTWKNDETGLVKDGFIAHEVQEVVPQAVTGEKDGPIDEEGRGYQGLDPRHLVPVLTAALQEAISKIETLETKVAALEGA